MRYLKLFENFEKRDFNELNIEDIEYIFIDGTDSDEIRLTNFEKITKSIPASIFSKHYKLENLFDNDEHSHRPPMIEFVVEIKHPKGVRNASFNINGYTKSIIKMYLQRLYDIFDVNVFVQIINTSYMEEYISRSNVYIQPKSRSVKESIESKSTLLIVDVQKSFKKFFNDIYLNALNKYCKNFNQVYQIFDNHVEGKNVDKDYLYDENPEIPVNGDLYTFPNQVDIIEKRYNYDVDVDFYKKILSKETYNIVKSKEDKGQLKRGDYFITTENTIIVYIGNNHRWHHMGKKLYDLFIKLRGKDVVMVGGADNECFLDIEVAAKSLGVNVIRDQKFIYSATNCPIK